MPDAPGLELILSDINAETPGAVLDTSFDREQAAPGDTVHLTALWQANADGASSAECDRTLLLLEEDGAIAQRASEPIALNAIAGRP